MTLKIFYTALKSDPESLLEEETEEKRKEYADGCDLSITVLAAIEDNYDWMRMSDIIIDYIEGEAYEVLY